MMILVGNNPYKMNVGHFRFLSSRRTYTLPETKPANLHLKMEGWKTILSFWDGFLAGAMFVSGRVGSDNLRGFWRGSNRKIIDISGKWRQR